MKKNFWKRIGVLTLTFVLAAMLLPGFVVKAEAATSATTANGFTTTITGFRCTECGNEFTAPDENHHFQINSATYQTEVNGNGKITVNLSYKTCGQDTAYTDEMYFSPVNFSCDQQEHFDYKKSTGASGTTVVISFSTSRSITPHQGSATCMTAASCTVCGKSYLAPHNPTGNWIPDATSGTHYKACANPGCDERVEETPCTYSDATCTAASACSVCGFEYAPIDADNHDYTWTSDGTQHWKVCSRSADHISQKTPCTLTRSYVVAGNGFEVTESCADCGHSAVATVSLGSEPITYTGAALTPATVSYPESWLGAKDLVPTYQGNVNAGEATCTLGDKTLTFTITPAQLTDAMIALTPASGTYTGAAHDPAVKLTFGGRELAAGTDYTLSDWSGDLTAVGSHTLTATGQGNFTGTCTAAFNIAKADPVYTAPTAISGLVYTGSPQTLVSGGDVAGLTMRYSLDNTTWSAELPQAVDAGTYTVYWAIDGGANYNAANGTVEVTVAKVQAVYTAPEANTLTYTGEAQALLTAGTSEHGTFRYRLESQEEFSDTIPTGTNAGAYTVLWKLVGDTNHQDAEGRVKVTLGRAELPEDLTFAYTEPTDFVYDGTAKSVTLTPSLADLKAEDLMIRYSADPVNAGSYTFTVSVKMTQNYKASTGRFQNDAWKFTIAKATPTLTWSATEYTYTGRPQGVVTVGLAGEDMFAGTIAYSHQKGTEDSVSGMPTNVGTYTLTVSVPEQTNYTAVTGTHTMTIKPKAITVSLVLAKDTFSYDGTAKTPAVKVMSGADQLPAAEYTLVYADNTAVGAATATVKAREGGNYTFDDTNAVFLILPDTSDLEGVTTANVKSTHQEAIDTIQAAMSGKTVTGAGTAAQAEWNAIVKKCADLETRIHLAAATKTAIQEGAAALPAQPTTDDYDDIKDLVDAYEEVEGNLTSAEKKALEEELELLQDHLEELEEVMDALEEIAEGTAALDEDDLDFADKATINALQAKIDALEDNDYLSEDDLEDLAAAEDTLADLEDAFAEADKVTTQLNALSTTADPDSKTAIDAYAAAKKAYDDLGADKSKVDPAAVKKLTDLYTELTDYAIIKVSATRWYKTSGKELTFTANGYYPNFIGVKVDGLLIDSSNYTSKSGSTIVSLKATYLEKLTSGNHTIAICFGGDLAGTAEGTFRVDTYIISPATGDRSNIQLWLLLAALSFFGLGTAALIALMKRKK